MRRRASQEERMEALIKATIAEVGQAGSLDIRVSDIAKRAGVSSALAHHYFGNKEQLFIAAMRQIIADFSRDLTSRLRGQTDPRLRITAIIDTIFAKGQVVRELVASWLAFYARAQTCPESRRLLKIYVGRLHSNLLFNLKQLVDQDAAEEIATSFAAMTNGFYLRHALGLYARDRDQEKTKKLIQGFFEQAMTTQGEK